MPPRILPEHQQNATPPILFDPDGDVLISDHLDAFYEESKPMLNDYVRHSRIGKGQHGDVYLCHKINPRRAIDDPLRRIPVAMKSVKRNNPRMERLKKLKQNRFPPASPAHIPVADKLNTTEAKIKREIAIMKKLRHPHVVRLYEVIDDRIQEKIYMVMEYLGGGEVKWRDNENNPVLTVSQTRRILRDAVLGLEYLHNQGIIHRDIKPANLLWTEDRRQVKIADFGVSHFSYAQRLAAAGGQTNDDPDDPILLDESGLTRRAGTPSFLAPEVIYDFKDGFPSSVSSISSSPLQSSTSIPASPGSLTSIVNRPPITKSIDVWALGVTLYCLLFGTTPFVPRSDSGAEGGTEYALYKSIHQDDWPAPPTMGFDKVPTGGRHPAAGPIGAEIIHLLEHFLQKDATVRITIEEVKTNHWFLSDLNNAQHWLDMTSNNHDMRINVSVNEATDAMSEVRFRWRWGRLAHHVSSFFRRPPRVKAKASRIHNLPNDIVSDPTVAFTEEETLIVRKNNKGKQKAETHRSRTLKRPASKGTKSLRSKSIERWSEKARGNSTSTSALQDVGLIGPSTKRRRGSDPRALDRVGTAFRPVTPLAMRTIKAKEGAIRPQPTNTTREHKRARFSLFNVANVINWRPNYAKFRNQSAANGAAAGTMSTVPLMTASVVASAAVVPEEEPEPEPIIPEETQSIAEIVQTTHNGGTVGPNDPGVLTAARRASSWGQGDTDLAEIVNVPSIGYNLNEHELFVGAGGVAVDGITVPAVLPGPSTPRRRVHGPEEDDYRRYGQPVYDDDSSTIASLHEHDDDRDHDHDDEEDDDDLDERGSWQRGSALDDDGDSHHHDHDDDDDDFYQSSDDDDDDDEDDHPRGPVTFSPRRHAQAN